MVTWVWEWSAPKRWPQPSVGRSSLPSCLLSLLEEVIGVTRLVNLTPYPARWQAAAAQSWCVSSLPPAVLESCPLLCPRSCSWWLVLMTATPPPGAAQPPLETLVSLLYNCGLCFFFFLLALLSLTSAVVVLSLSGEKEIRIVMHGRKTVYVVFSVPLFNTWHFCLRLRNFLPCAWASAHLWFLCLQPRLPLMPSQRLTATWPLTCGRRQSSQSLPTRSVKWDSSHLCCFIKYMH